MSGILRLESLTKGNTLKQGDKTPLKYRLFDADGEQLDIAGKSAVARLMYPDFLRAGYESETLTVSPDNTVTFSIDKVIEPVLYYVEITVDDKYIFPSRVDESKINIDKSSKGSDVAIIEIIGKDILIRDVREQVETEIKPVVDDMIIANQKVLENEKIVQDVNSLAQQLENRQNQVEQFNNQVITEMTDKDVISAPEIIEARIDLTGKTHDRMSDRLNSSDIKHEDIVYLNNFEILIPEMYDTGRLQRALDYAHEKGLKHLSITKGLTVHEPVEIYADYLTIFSPTTNDHHVKIKTTSDFGNQPIFDVKVEGVTFQNLDMSGDNDAALTAGQAIGVRYDFRIPDCDSYIINCNFRYLKHGVVAKGRNVRMISNTFALVNFPITLSKFEGTSQYGNDMRGFWIKDNIFHSCGAPTELLDFATILTVTDVTVGQDVIFEGNKIEGAVNTIFKGSMYGVKFRNNDITAPIMGWGFDISNTPSDTSGVRFGEITNNNFIGAKAGTTVYAETMHFIKGDILHNLNINDNIFNSSTKEAIIANVMTNVSIQSNTFKAISYSAVGVHDVIKTNNSVTNTFINNNVVYDNTYRHLVYVGANMNNSSVHNNHVPPNREKVEVVVTGNVGDKNINVAMTASSEIVESIDARNTFGGAEIHRKEYKRVNPQDNNKKITVAVERKVVEPFDSASNETIVNGGMAFDVADNGVLTEVVKFNKYGATVKGTIAFGEWRMWIDSDGNVRKKKGIPTNDTDGTIV